jgi:hypothetical protein
MKLYLIHCGYYDPTVANGVYESHVNLFCAAEHREQAALRIKETALFKSRQMHLDGIEEVTEVDGFKVVLA